MYVCMYAWMDGWMDGLIEVYMKPPKGRQALTKKRSRQIMWSAWKQYYDFSD